MLIFKEIQRICLTVLRHSIYAAFVGYLISGLTNVSHAASSLVDFSSWVFYSGKTQRGTDLCSISTASKGPQMRNVSIKQLANSNSISITIFNSEWNFQNSAVVPVTLDFSDQQPLLLEAYGDGKFLDIALPNDFVTVFLSLLADRSLMRLQVGGRTNQIWVVPLSGIKPELKSFVSCSLLQEKGATNKQKTPPTQTLGSCKEITFTGLGAIDPGAIDMALSAGDPEDYVARNPILCTRSNHCRGLGYFKNQRAKLMNEHGDYAYVVTPIDFIYGRRDIYLAILRADAKCKVSTR